MKIIVSFITLLGFISTRSFKDTKSILAQMETSQFGQGMLSLLQANKAVDSPMTEVVDILNNIVDQLNNDQEAADRKNVTDQNACVQNFNAYTSTISTLTSQISNLETLIEENEGILALAKTTLAQAKTDYTEVVGEINSGTIQRDEEHQSWRVRDDQANVDIVTLEEGVRLIQHMLHGVSFSEISSRYNKVLTQLGSSSQSTLYRPLVSQLSQLASKMNFDNVQKVLELLNSMRKNIVDERAADLASEEQQQKDWEKLLKQLARQKKQLEDKIRKNEILIATTAETLKNSRVSLARAEVSKENNEKLLKKQETTCANESSTYLSESAERERELEILDQLLTHMEDQKQAVMGYLEERAANSPPVA